MLASCSAFGLEQSFYCVACGDRNACKLLCIRIGAYRAVSHCQKTSLAALKSRNIAESDTGDRADPRLHSDDHLSCQKNVSGRIINPGKCNFRLFHCLHDHRIVKRILHPACERLFFQKSARLRYIHADQFVLILFFLNIDKTEYRTVISTFLTQIFKLLSVSYEDRNDITVFSGLISRLHHLLIFRFRKCDALRILLRFLVNLI